MNSTPHNNNSIVIVASLANEFVVSRLVRGATETCLKSGILESNIFMHRVPGALEIPLLLNKIAKAERHFGYIVLGAIIKGKSDHYEHVSRLAHDGVLATALKYDLALGNGIMTVHSIEQAIERADGPLGNLGVDAALSCLSLGTTFTTLKNNQ